jgi:hypothetical protein
MKDMLPLISMQSRGMTVNVAIDGPAAPFWEKGKEIYYTRFGQLEMSCANPATRTTGQVHPRRPPEPGPDQRLSGLPPEGCRASCRPSSGLSAVSATPGPRRSSRTRKSSRRWNCIVASRGNGLSVEGVACATRPSGGHRPPRRPPNHEDKQRRAPARRACAIRAGCPTTRRDGMITRREFLQASLAASAIVWRLGLRQLVAAGRAAGADAGPACCSSTTSAT